MKTSKKGKLAESGKVVPKSAIADTTQNLSLSNEQKIRKS
jgi:hypothetical protein